MLADPIDDTTKKLGDNLNVLGNIEDKINKAGDAGKVYLMT